MASTATITQSPSRAANPGFFTQLSAEWTKMRSTRAFYIQVFLALGLGLVMTALICLAIGSSFEDFNAEDQATFDPVFTSFFGGAFAGIVMIVLGVTATSSEYTSGMVRLSFAATPQRGRWLSAKSVLVLLVTLVVGIFVSLGGFFIGQAVLGSYEGVPTASLSDSETLRAVVAAWLTTPMWPLLGTALGVILRSTASAITTTLTLLFAPAIFGSLLPRWWEENFIAYLPSNAGDSLLVTERTETSIYLDPGVAVIVIAAWMVIFFGVAYVLLKKRDV